MIGWAVVKRFTSFQQFGSHPDEIEIQSREEHLLTLYISNANYLTKYLLEKVLYGCAYLEASPYVSCVVLRYVIP